MHLFYTANPHLSGDIVPQATPSVSECMSYSLLVLRLGRWRAVGTTIEDIQVEIATCVPLCRSCHMAEVRP